MQNTQNMQNMQNMQNISPLFFLSKEQKSKISESESSINSRTCLGHLVLFNLFFSSIQFVKIKSSSPWSWSWCKVNEAIEKNLRQNFVLHLSTICVTEWQSLLCSLKFKSEAEMWMIMYFVVSNTSLKLSEFWIH